MGDFYVGNDGKVHITFMKDGAYTNPATVKITAYAPDGTKKVNAADMTQESTGKYYYFVSLDTAGRWVFYIDYTDSAGHTNTDRYEHNVAKKVTP